MKKLALATALTALAAPAMAHTGHGDASGLAHGFLHPMLGADHLLAMLGVGLWSGFALPRKVWAGAASFLAAMTAGAGLAWAGVALPAVETWIAASVLLVGLLVALSQKGGRVALPLAGIAVFAAAHGHAHAAEATGAAGAYLAGFLASTALLHLLGIAVARGAGAGLPQKLMGGAIAGAGLLMLAG
ncbi:HupE/UreJ family protein [Cereibacter sphaeroides]|uniref:HupE/UreJ family protein n=1 Tax=Cereibacter sphaeroides TaxID=1063 RepID=UPI001F231A01|nr:HupE/UreJ family protein [Cereibacter sphaeroides]MCE6950208.1 HupE/UreJ family protein [Cereibacter sphaeroides]